MALTTDESGILGGQKWHLHTKKLHFVVFKAKSEGEKVLSTMLFFSRMGVQAEGA